MTSLPIQISATLHVNKGSLNRSIQLPPLNLAMSGTTRSGLAQTIGTTSTALDFGTGFTSPGYGFFRNLDAENFIEIGVEDSGPTFIPMLRLNPGEYALVRLATATIFARADTDPALLDFEFFAA